MWNNYDCFTNTNQNSFDVSVHTNEEGQLVADLICDEEPHVAWADLEPIWTGSDVMWETPSVSRISEPRISEPTNWLEDAWVNDPELDREPDIFYPEESFNDELEESCQDQSRCDTEIEDSPQESSAHPRKRATPRKRIKSQENGRSARVKRAKNQENQRPDVVLPHPNSYQLGFWNTVPVMMTEDLVPTIIPLQVMNGKTKTSDYFRTAKRFCARFPNQWKLRGDAQAEFGGPEIWHNARGSLKGEPMANTKSDAWPQVRDGCAPVKDSFVMARFGGEWYMMNWTI